jgi:hypothetical protein
MSADDVLRTHDVFGDALVQLHAGAPSNRKGISTAAIKCGVVLRMALHPNDAEYAVTSFRSLTLLRFEDVSPSVASFGRRMLAVNSASANTDETICLAYRTFTASNGDKIRAFMKDIDPVRAELRNRANQLFGKV